MTDLQMMTLCGDALTEAGGYIADGAFDPLYNDVQAMALLKMFPVNCIDALDCLIGLGPVKDEECRHYDFNRAIVERVARMQAAIRTEVTSDS